MDSTIYPQGVIDKFLNENMLFNDVKLKKYYDRNEQRDLKKFRERVHNKYSTKDFDKIVYALITDSIRDIILETISKVNDVMKSMGDLIISGGEAYNMYVPYEDRIVTTDIDAKFVPRMKMDSEYYGKLQVVKLVLWDKLGEIAQTLNMRIKRRLLTMIKKSPKIFKFLGLGFKQTGPYVTRRYNLFKKKKVGKNKEPKKGDVFIDVELFALDMNIRSFSPKSGRVEDFTVGGILDIPFMRPEEFGYSVSVTKRKGVTYRNVETNKLVVNNDIFIAGRDFLIEDIYLMHKLNLRPEKKDKDRQRLLKLIKLIDAKLNLNTSIDAAFKHIQGKLAKRSPTRKVYRNVSMNRASRIDPQKYSKFTTKPRADRLSKQFVYGLNPVLNNTNVPGYTATSGNKRFDLNTLKWKTNTNNSYVKNEYKLRPNNAQKLPANINKLKTLYGYKPSRNKWIPRSVLEKAAAIPYIGLKK